jgi:hypothetical protein
VADNKLFQVSVDAEELRNLYTKYGSAVMDAAIDKIASDLKFKIKSSLKLSDFVGVAKPLVEIIK